jgi:hypothetical protein
MKKLILFVSVFLLSAVSIKNHVKLIQATDFGIPAEYANHNQNRQICLAKVNGDTIVCIFYSGFGSTEYSSTIRIFFMQSYDSGLTWTQPDTLIPYWATDVAIGAFNDTIICLYDSAKAHAPDIGHARIRVSYDNGRTWTKHIPVSIAWTDDKYMHCGTNVIKVGNLFLTNVYQLAEAYPLGLDTVFIIQSTNCEDWTLRGSYIADANETSMVWGNVKNKLMAISRTWDDTLSVFYSADTGKTWVFSHSIQSGIRTPCDVISDADTLYLVHSEYDPDYLTDSQRRRLIIEKSIDDSSFTKILTIRKGEYGFTNIQYIYPSMTIIGRKLLISYEAHGFTVGGNSTGEMAILMLNN